MPKSFEKNSKISLLAEITKKYPAVHLSPVPTTPPYFLPPPECNHLCPIFWVLFTPKENVFFDTQKCFRTPDIDEVGDDTHHTFFEMLGNWSLGDYFKEEAIDLAYDFFVKELGLDPKRFAITIFKGDSDAPRDDEAEQIWLSKPGITKKQIFEFDKEDNFWGPAGKTGPCGPCSEIHYDRGEKFGEDVGPNSDENQRYVEIWNLVFMEYDKKEDGTYEKLAQKNVDTGVGFERLLAVLQQKDSAFATELFTDILKKIEEISGKKYANEKRSFRIIADHVRGSSFAIADGVTPGNEGRNYVLRRLIRRAVREGKKLGIKDLFLSQIARVVIDEYKAHYPELEENQNTILAVLDIEEKNFRETLERGEKMLQEIQEEGKKEISGDSAFQLFDTYGFPLDLTKDFAEEHGLIVDEEGFEKEMEKQKERSRGAKKFDRSSAVQAFVSLSATIFTGYDSCAEDTKISGIQQESDEAVVVLEKTPFYAESGGQVGDSGVIEGKNGTLLVTDCQKTASGVFLHSGKLKGSLEKGEGVSAKIDTKRRGQIMRHHSLAHLFLGAAQKVLGKDVHQAGSHVNEHRMRFDFTFPRALKPEEILEIERLATESVTASRPVDVEEKSLADAKTEGVEATFGEKYGDEVRTIRMGEFSFELCGGTHVQNTAQIGAVKIISEAGVSAGVRRIEMVCAESAENLLQEQFLEIKTIAEKLKVPENEIFNRLDSIFSERKEMQNEIGCLQKKMAEYEADEYTKQAEEKGGKNIFVITDKETDGKTAGTLARSVVAKGVDIAIICTKSGNIAVATTGNVSAKELLQKISTAFGGGGGGSDQFASGGGATGVTKEGLLQIL
jgi:alanyl-tRNA synthetase